jgi:hypothetical protein
MERNKHNKHALLALLAALALGLLLAGCGAAQSSPDEGLEGSDKEPYYSGSYVGEIPEADAFVAVIAEEPEAGENSRKVRAYLCDGKRNPLSEWFTGSAEGNGFDLASESGARLEGELTPEGASGTVTLKSGETFHFEVTPATGVAGL